MSRATELRGGCDPVLGLYEFKVTGDRYKIAFKIVLQFDQHVLDDIKGNGRYAFLRDRPATPVSARWR